MSGGWRHAVGVGLVALGLLAAGSQLHRWLPSDDDDPGSEPFLRAGVVGQAVDLRTATVTVESVSGSRTVEEYGSELVSPGVWVVARYTVVADRENTPVTFAELEDGAGRLWTLTGRNANVCLAGPPGVETHCAAYFEVPPDALPSLRLHLARESRDTRYDVVADVDLGLTEADAGTFGSAAPIDIPTPSLGGKGPR